MILKFGRNKCKGNQNKNITLQSEYFYYPVDYLSQSVVLQRTTFPQLIYTVDWCTAPTSTFRCSP